MSRGEDRVTPHGDIKSIKNLKNFLTDRKASDIMIIEREVITMTNVTYTLSNGTTVKTFAEAEKSGLKYKITYSPTKTSAPKPVPAVRKGLV